MVMQTLAMILWVHSVYLDQCFVVFKLKLIGLLTDFWKRSIFCPVISGAPLWDYLLF